MIYSYFDKYMIKPIASFLRLFTGGKQTADIKIIVPENKEASSTQKMFVTMKIILKNAVESTMSGYNQHMNHSHDEATTFSRINHANETIPAALRLPQLHSGKDYTVYETEMDNAYGKDPQRFEELFRKHVATYNNISGSVIHFPSGSKNVYRSAMLAFSPDTLKELIKERGVKTIIHLSNKKTVDQKLWTQTEKEHFFKLGGKEKNYIHILDFDYLFNDEDELSKGQKKVAEIINIIEHSEGNVLIHCLGGEHKTEIIFEVMQKVYNHVDLENIITRYKYHTAWSPDPKVKSGYKQNNIDFIRDFPDELLDAVVTRYQPTASRRIVNF